MTQSRPQSTVNIRPGVKILSVLSHLNYRPWFAVAEFVDNSIQSYLDNIKELEELEGREFRLRIEIELDGADGGRLVVRDNAAGIHRDQYARAFRPAALPADRSGLSEFGMGMKSAACWFSPYWTVRTSAFGESYERTITFDVDAIVRDEIEELTVMTKSVAEHRHYTEIVMERLHQVPQKKTTGKIKDHLSSIYRIFIRSGQIEIRYNGSALTYEAPKVLLAPLYSDEASTPVHWRKEIDFDFGQGMRAHGFAALREKASTAEAGFALFRRNRVIQGSADETYRPHAIFGAPNSYRYQRLFGELHLEGFSVSHTKDGFQWDENEQAFLDLLKEHLNDPRMPLLDQAEGFRTLQRTRDLRNAAQLSTDRVTQTIRDHVPDVLEEQIEELPEQSPAPFSLASASEVAAKKSVRIEVLNDIWEVVVELTNDPAIGDWISYSANERYGEARYVTIRLSLAHPFMVQFGGSSAEQIEPLQRVAIAIVLSEITARESGVSQAGTIRRNINRLLREALAKP